MRKGIGKDIEEGLVSAPFTLEELRGKYHKVLLNSSVSGIKDIDKPDVRTLAESTQGGTNQKIHLAMRPTRPGLADVLRVLDIPENPAAAKWGGTFARRRILKPKPEHGLVSIMEPGGEFYAYTVGASGVVSPGQIGTASQTRPTDGL